MLSHSDLNSVPWNGSPRFVKKPRRQDVAVRDQNVVAPLDQARLAGEGGWSKPSQQKTKRDEGIVVKGSEGEGRGGLTWVLASPMILINRSLRLGMGMPRGIL